MKADTQGTRAPANSGPAWFQEPPSRFEHRALAGLTILILLLAALSYTLKSYDYVSAGGGGFVQGDWLTNFAGGFVRRGASGSLILAISDVTRWPLLRIVQAFQTVAIFSFAGGLFLALKKLSFPPKICILVISPTFISFFFNNYISHGKVVLGALAFLPLVALAFRGKWAVFHATVCLLLFAVSSLFYEPALLFAPSLIVAAFAIWSGGQVNKTFFVYFSLSIGVLFAAITIFTMKFAQVAEWEPMCDVLLNRGLDSNICSKFHWNSTSTSDAIHFATSVQAIRVWWAFGVTVVLSVAPIILFSGIPRTRSLIFWAAMAATISFVPLYFFGIDFGRWLNMQVIAVTMVILVAVSAGCLPEFKNPISRRLIFPWVVLAFLWGLNPVSGSLRPGIILGGSSTDFSVEVFDDGPNALILQNLFQRGWSELAPS